MKKLFIYFLAISIIALSCSKKEDNTNNEPKCSITNPSTDTTVHQGESLSISVTASDDDGNIAQVNLYIDDVEIANINEAPYEYEWNTTDYNIGNHVLKAKAIDNNGLSTSDETTITIEKNGVAPVAMFSANTTSITLGESVSFSDESTENPTQWAWDFGDGESSNEQNPVHTYSSANTYDVSLTVTNEFGSNTINKSAFIIVSEGAINIETGTVTDVDNNTYKTVKINNQWWMAENLATTKYNDGTEIPNITDKDEWSNLESEAFCFYKNEEENYKETYGALYNYYTVNTKKLCPSGWHVPSNDEFMVLIDLLGGIPVAGAKLKETGTSHWTEPNLGATNEVEFNLLPAGLRQSGGMFFSVGEFSELWTSTLKDEAKAWKRSVTYDQEYIGKSSASFNYGLSVRCIKD